MVTQKRYNKKEMDELDPSRVVLLLLQQFTNLRDSSLPFPFISFTASYSYTHRPSINPPPPPCPGPYAGPARSYPP